VPTTNDPFMVRAQFAVIFFYAALFAIVLILFIVMAPTLDEFIKGILLTMLGYLGALVQQQSSYIFARQRPDTPVAGETTVTTSPVTTTVTASVPATATTVITPAQQGGPTVESSENS
jgi:hypothetical protein